MPVLTIGPDDIVLNVSFSQIDDAASIVGVTMAFHPPEMSASSVNWGPMQMLLNKWTFPQDDG